jgi:hypothetical protein
VFEEITIRDETSTICTNGARTLPNGGLSLDGPPTTLSDTGIDRVGFFQANIIRDKTNFVNGTPVGSRTIFQVRLPHLFSEVWRVRFLICAFIFLS